MEGSSNSLPGNNSKRDIKGKLNSKAQSTVDEEINLPCGYRFSPTESELIVYYLNTTVLGRPPPLNIIKELNVYDFDPDQLPISDFIYGKSNQAYYFTRSEQKNLQGLRPKLTRERGYWKASFEDVEIILCDQIIGFKNILNFYWGKAPEGEKSGWKIQEYRVNPELFPVYSLIASIRREIEERVICKIRYKEIDDENASEEENIARLLAESSSDDEEEPNLAREGSREEENQIGNTITKETDLTRKGKGKEENQIDNSTTKEPNLSSKNTKKDLSGKGTGDSKGKSSEK